MNLKAYLEAKQRHPGMLLLFRVGDDYELYGVDAEIAAKLLGLDLTTRTGQGAVKKVLIAGFPQHSLQSHLRNLLQAGHRVAICDQFEEPTTQEGQPTLFDDDNFA